MKLLILSVLFSAFILNSANASEHSEKMCSKIKECVLSQAGGDEIPEQMKAIFIQTVDSQCAAMASRYADKYEAAGVQGKANACVDSIVEQSCEKLMSNNGEPDTQDCKDFEKAANEAGIAID